MSATYEKCLVDGCERNSKRWASGKRGYCSMHYSRVLKHGDPLRVDRVPSPAQDWLSANAAYAGDECLIWPFHTGADGYGRAHHPVTGRLSTAARLMCLLAHGDAPSPLHEAAHRCGKGNTGCVNPGHLYWATPAQNHADRVTHGTSNRGTRQWQARLTEAEVREIRKLIGSRPLKTIADQFGVHLSHIAHIKSRRAWGWLP